MLFDNRSHILPYSLILVKSLSQIYQQHEKEKMGKYNKRVIDIEKPLFNPHVFTISGGMAPESTKKSS